MRHNKKHQLITLEQDIIKTWQRHGLKVKKISVNGNIWEIQAK